MRERIGACNAGAPCEANSTGGACARCAQGLPVGFEVACCDPPACPAAALPDPAPTGMPPLSGPGGAALLPDAVDFQV